MQRKARPLLTEKENEIRMKIDEAERKDSFHQQVCQMKLGDKSRCGRSLGLVQGCRLLPLPAVAGSREINGYS